MSGRQSAEPKRRGRPPLPEGASKQARVELRTTPERKAKAERLAQRDGLSLSTWLERLIDAASK